MTDQKKRSKTTSMVNKKDHNESIGKDVISVDFGLGTITSVQKLDDILDDFFVVECMQSNLKNFIPTRDQTGFRFISSKDDLNQILESFDTNSCPYFNSRKDRIDFFKSSLSIESFDQLVQIVSDMSQLKDLSTTEKRILKKVVDSILLEISYVMDYKIEDSKQFLENHLDIAI